MTNPNESNELASMRKAFADKYPEDDALIRLAENNHDFRVEAIGARHALIKFNGGWKACAAQASLATPKPHSVSAEQIMKIAFRCLPPTVKEVLQAHEAETMIRAILQYALPPEPISADEHKKVNE